MAYPKVILNLDYIEANTGVIAHHCRRHAIQLVGVTKVCCGSPEVAGAMLRGGAEILADSRLGNLAKLRQAGITIPLMLLRLPMVTEAQDVVSLADISLNSEIKTLQALSAAATQLNKKHRVILMVDLGDLREGLLPSTAEKVFKKVYRLPGLEFIGLGTNFACYGGVVPTPENLNQLVTLRDKLERDFQVRLPVLSGGNSSSIPLLLSGQIPPQINQLRIGEGIILGRETIHRNPIPGTCQDTARLVAEVIEEQSKPSIPRGEVSQDAFGEHPVFIDRGERCRAILAVGRQDVTPKGLELLTPGLEIIGASSDHLIIDVTGQHRKFPIGSTMEFVLNYAGLLGAMTSPYVEKEFLYSQNRQGTVKP